MLDNKKNKAYEKVDYEFIKKTPIAQWWNTYNRS